MGNPIKIGCVLVWKVEDHDAQITLRGGGSEVNHELEEEIRERLEMAGIKVIEARINFIAYSEEIAGAMLRRQQATAVVAAMASNLMVVLCGDKDPSPVINTGTLHQ